MRTVLTTLIAALTVASTSVRAEDWTTAYAGLGRTSYLQGEAIAPPFAVLWQAELPQPVKGAPIVSGLLGFAYLATPQLHVFALKLSDGTIAWKHDEPRSANIVRCYDALTGALRWEQTVDGNLIHTPQVGMAAVYVASSAGSLYAFNQIDGKQIWKVSLGSPLTLPAADAGLLVIGSGSKLIGLNPLTGANIFSLDAGGVISSVPALADDGAYVALTDTVIAVSRLGAERWRATLSKPAWASPAVTKAGVAVATVDGGIVLLSRASGAEVWETLLAGTPNTISGAGDVVYVGTRQGTVVGLRLTDGGKLWSAALGHGPIDGVGLSGGKVLVTAGTWVGALLPAPEPPTDVALHRAGRNGNLSWTAPSPNGSPISGYRIWRRRGQDFTPVATASAATFAESLLPGEVGYAVSAIANNGAESARSGEVTLLKGEPLLRHLQAGPLPYDPRTGGLGFSFELRVAARVTWTVLDAEGHAVTTPRTSFGSKGTNSLSWDGRTTGAAEATPGIYRVSVTAEITDETETQAKAIPIHWDAGTAINGPLAGPAGNSGTGGVGPAGLGNGPTGGNGGGSPATTGGTGGGGPAAAGSAPAGAHDNGWHNGNNPNGLTINHDDKSQGNGNNHH